MARTMELLLACFLVILGSVLGQQEIDLDTLELGRMFEGIGGISGGGATSKLLVNYPQKQRDEILDYLFKPNFGASLHILKVEIGGDAQSTDGSESSHMHYEWEENYERGYEWWLMLEAKKRNPDIKLYGLSWGFPGFLRRIDNTPFLNNTKTAEYIVKWVNAAKVFYNLTIDFIGIWNERPYEVDYIRILRKTLDSHGFQNVLLVVGDNSWEAVTDIHNDPDLAPLIYALGCHYPGTYAWDQAVFSGKPLWASEDYSTFNDNIGAGCWARILNQNYVNGYMTSTISWNLIASYYGGLPYERDGLMTAEQPWTGHYVVDNPIWISAHTTQFTEIGWHYLRHGTGVGKLDLGGSYVSILSPDKQDLTIVIETMQHDHSKCIRPNINWFEVKKQDIIINLKGELAKFTEMDLWFTQLGYDGNNSTVFQKLDTIKFVNGSFKLSLGLDQIYTLTTVKSGNHGSYPDPPAPKPFPLPYFDDFEGVQVYQEPFNLAQQAGSFEVLTDGKNKFVRQMLIDIPVMWCFAEQSGKGITYIGNYSWSDIFLEVDFRCSKVNASSGVFLASRLDRSGCDTQLTSGAFFGMYCDGAWTLHQSISDKELDHGTVDIHEEWNKLSLLIHGHQIMGASNGVGIFNETIYDIPGSGFAAFGTLTFGLADFDNLHIKTAEDGLAIMDTYFHPHQPLFFQQEHKIRN
ncbi:galactocerebrosidase [Biomphalaria pfeifferi]|uniref:galactosylceramidase n=1 Tax=Biomphalaria pfeifferi TaxID=112525 RepID=A0AAD8B7E0_BIOPF|nr:galactocerebrosidase [Biomphalaria pfeifferi]